MIEIIEENPTYKTISIYNVCSGYRNSVYGFKWKKIKNDDIVQLT